MEIPLFPYDSAPLTLTTTIWLGVLVAVFFNLRFGWTLSGLVIPGYIVPIFMSRPMTAFIILAEAAITYWIVLAISETPRKLPYWSSLFGRDRFFLILVISVLVRAMLDGWLLPAVGHMLVNTLDVNFDYRNNFNSFGLIAVALIANFFWKPGVVTGLIQVLVCTCGCYLLIQLLLLVTNFSVGSFDSIYADISLDLLKSPKCYIVLLTTAYIASQMNLKYSWEFNGIMIPSLLALIWHSPIAIFTALFEAALILVVASWLLQTPLFQKMTMEGGRKIAFFFTVCFCYRFGTVHVMELLGQKDAAADCMGTGYLLSTLIATKAHDKKILLRMVKGIAEISMLGAVTGSLIGFAFFCAPPIHWTGGILNAFGPPPELALPNEHGSGESLSQMMRKDKIALYDKSRFLKPIRASAAELSLFSEALVVLRDLPPGNAPSGKLDYARQLLHTVGYEVIVAEGRYFYLREAAALRGWGMFVIDASSHSSLAIHVPRPVADWATLESGVCLLQEFGARTLAVSADLDGAKKRVFERQGRRSFHTEFHEVFGCNSVVEVHALKSEHAVFARSHSATNPVNKDNRRKPLIKLSENEGIDRSADPKNLMSRLIVKRRIPRGLRLNELRELTSSFEVSWDASDATSSTSVHSQGDFVELLLSEVDRIRLVSQLVSNEFARGFASDETVSREKRAESATLPVVNETLNEWLVEQKRFICPQGSNQYVPTSLEQVMFMDNEVVTPLLKVLKTLPSVSQNADLDSWLTERIRAKLITIQSAAYLLDYQISMIRDPFTGDLYVALSESPVRRDGELKTKGWGIFVFRPGLAESFGVEIPRPLFERRSLDFGMYLFQRPRSAAILIAGAHPRANLDGSSDICKAANRTNLFNLVRHSLLQELADRPFLITQARAIQAPVETDLVMATEDGTTELRQLTPLKQSLYRQLERDRLSITFVDGRPETAGYELGILMQAMSVQISENKEIVSLWLSPAVRSRFREHSDNLSLAAQFEACRIPRVTAGLHDYVVEYLNKIEQMSSGNSRQVTVLPEEARQTLQSYSQSLDVIQLYGLRSKLSDWKFELITNGQAGHMYLLIAENEEAWPLIFNVTGTLTTDAVVYENEIDDSLQRFIGAGFQWWLPSKSLEKCNDSKKDLSPVVALEEA